MLATEVTAFYYLNYSAHRYISHCYITGFQIKTVPCTTGQKEKDGCIEELYFRDDLREFLFYPRNMQFTLKHISEKDLNIKTDGENITGM